jgi:hypothetical protein
MPEQVPVRIQTSQRRSARGELEMERRSERRSEERRDGPAVIRGCIFFLSTEVAMACAHVGRGFRVESASEEKS